MISHAVLAAPGTGELIIKKSVFVTQLFPTTSEQQAREVIAQVRQRYPQARHHCTAFVLTDEQPQQVQRSSDDGEPAGTAGMPMLQALLRHRVHGLAVSDLTAVVSRWFGGIKLGAGGLIRAYAQSVTEALQSVSWRQRALCERREISIAVADLGRLDAGLRRTRAHLLDQQFDADRVRWTLGLPIDDDLESLRADLTSLFAQPLPASTEPAVWLTLDLPRLAR